MIKVNHTDKVILQSVKRFCDQVVWLRSVHRIYKELFESKSSQELMDKTAQSFFNDLNVILINYLLLEFVKITDPSVTKGEENFTIDNLVESINWPKEVDDKLRGLNEKAKTFRGYTIKTRNKLFAHMDKKTILSGKSLGDFPKGEDERFLITLEEICNITHQVCFNSIFGSLSLSMLGDVQNLKESLIKGLVFDRLFSESKGEEKIKLLNYLHSWPNNQVAS